MSKENWKILNRYKNIGFFIALCGCLPAQMSLTACMGRLYLRRG